MAPYDILAEYNGSILRIQVKGTGTSYQKDSRSKNRAYKFAFSKNDCNADIIAFVALDIEKVIYQRVKSIKVRKTMWVTQSKMDAGSDSGLTDFLGEKLGELSVNS